MEEDNLQGDRQARRDVTRILQVSNLLGRTGMMNESMKLQELNQNKLICLYFMSK